MWSWGFIGLLSEEENKYQHVNNPTWEQGCGAGKDICCSTFYTFTIQMCVNLYYVEQYIYFILLSSLSPYCCWFWFVCSLIFDAYIAATHWTPQIPNQSYKDSCTFSLETYFAHKKHSRATACRNPPPHTKAIADILLHSFASTIFLLYLSLESYFAYCQYFNTQQMSKD